eukprot:7385143-Prymnesium_polylepis.1
MTIWPDDKGTTWSPPVSIEPSPVNTALANRLLHDESGQGRRRRRRRPRLRRVYNMNLANVSRDGPGGPHITRVDMLGTFNLRYSDDGGESWSSARCAAA